MTSGNEGIVIGGPPACFFVHCVKREERLASIPLTSFMLSR